MSAGLCLSQRQSSSQAAWLQGGSRTRAALWRFQGLEGHPTALGVLQEPLLGPCREQERGNPGWNRHSVREQLRAVLCLPGSYRAGKSFTTSIPKGHKTLLERAESPKCCCCTQNTYNYRGPCATVEKSVTAPKWGEKIAL